MQIRKEEKRNQSPLSLLQPERLAELAYQIEASSRNFFLIVLSFFFSVFSFNSFFLSFFLSFLIPSSFLSLFISSFFLLFSF